MKIRNWLSVIVAGVLIGLLIGLAQMLVFGDRKYSASLSLYERILFDEYWEAAPASLLEAELRRVELSSQSSGEKSKRDSIIIELLNGWFRLIDGTLFRFPIDEALKSNSIGRDIQRYARVNKGYVEGLNQRAVSFRVVGNDELVVKRELKRWVSSVQKASSEKANSAVKSWLSRKASGLKAVSEGEYTDLPENTRSEFQQMAQEFQNAADNFPSIQPYQATLSEIEVHSHPREWTAGVALWALIGAVVSVVSVLGLRAKRAA